MREKISCLITALAVCFSFSVATSRADDPANPTPPQMSRGECVAAHSAALKSLWACFDAKRTIALEIANSAVEAIASDGTIRTAAEIDADVEKTVYDGNWLEGSWRECLADFKATETGNAKSCEVLGTSGNRDLYCSEVRVIASSCAAHCNGICKCGQWFPVGACTQPNGKALINLDVRGCGSILPDKQQCLSSCEHVQDQQTCRADCTNNANRLIAACLGLSASATKPDLASPPSGRNKSQKVSLPVDKSQTASPGVKSNSLDRFGLGPSYAPTELSLPNQRTGGKAAQGGSSKQMPTTSLAKPPSTNSKRPSIDPNARIIKPTEQIK